MKTILGLLGMLYNNRRFLTIGLAILLYFFSPLIETRVTRLPTESMAPSFRKHDIIFIKKDLSSINRGDVVVYLDLNYQKYKYTQRIIGVPGDTVEIKNNVVFVNDKPIDAVKSQVKDISKLISNEFLPYELEAFESNTFGVKHMILISEKEDVTVQYSQNYQKVKVPKASYFLLGDNRHFSADSRSYGFIPRSQILGKAIKL